MELPLYEPSELVRYDRRWPVWGPVTLTAGGGALALSGALLTWYGQTKLETYDGDVSRQCGNLGCEGSAAKRLQDDKQRAELYRTVGIVSLSAGGAAFAGGIVLLYLNRAEPHRVEPKLKPLRSESAYLSPMLDPTTAGVVGGGRF